MSSGNNEHKEQHGPQETAASQHETQDAGRSGEGAASAMAHLISQGQQHRHQTGEADDAAGGRRQ
ncbi:hypothetical protein [Caenimonas koreensis]|uniref:hypothetical protein n=1 Tax=Caenimonas koreensis TaxID=367474 RepID=UPI0037848C2B